MDIKLAEYVPGNDEDVPVGEFVTFVGQELEQDVPNQLTVNSTGFKFLVARIPISLCDYRWERFCLDVAYLSCSITSRIQKCFQLRGYRPYFSSGDFGVGNVGIMFDPLKDYPVLVNNGCNVGFDILLVSEFFWSRWNRVHPQQEARDVTSRILERMPRNKLAGIDSHSDIFGESLFVDSVGGALRVVSREELEAAYEKWKNNRHSVADLPMTLDQLLNLDNSDTCRFNAWANRYALSLAISEVDRASDENSMYSGMHLRYTNEWQRRWASYWRGR